MKYIHIVGLFAVFGGLLARIFRRGAFSALPAPRPSNSVISHSNNDQIEKALSLVTQQRIARRVAARTAPTPPLQSKPAVISNPIQEMPSPSEPSTFAKPSSLPRPQSNPTNSSRRSRCVAPFLESPTLFSKSHFFLSVFWLLL